MTGKQIVHVEISGKGGICHYAYNLCNELSKSMGTVLVSSVNYEMESRKRNFDVVKIFNKFRTNPFRMFLFLNLLKDENTRVVHFQLSQYPQVVLLMSYMVKMFGGRKIVITAHNVLSHEERPFEKAVFSRIYSLSDGIIVHANANKRELLETFSVDAEKVHVIPHGNYEFFNEAEKEAPAPANSRNVLFFGYIRKYKGLMYLLKAISLVKKSMPEVKLFVVGKPVEDVSVYTRAVIEMGIEGNVEFNFGYVPFENVQEYFNKTNVVALPYLNIYQSGILQLAYGFGRPVVATDVGGLPEVVEDGKSGFIVPPGDENMLADRLLAVLGSPGLQYEMGKYALNLARTKYSWSSIASETTKLYRRI